MSAEQWEQVKTLYGAAVELDSSSRDDFLRCNAIDPVVSGEVRRLLKENDDLGSFLSHSAVPSLQLSSNPVEKHLVPGCVLAERFCIVAFIAAGGMGEVYEAEDLELKENLAIKTIRPEMLEHNDALTRFKCEVQLARKVTHPKSAGYSIFSGIRISGEMVRTAVPS